MTTDKQLLQATKDSLTEQTWAQVHVPTEKLCLGLAAARTVSTRLRSEELVNGSDTYSRIYRKIAAQISDGIPATWTDPNDKIIKFNDNPDTTLADVHAVLDKAIEAEGD